MGAVKTIETPAVEGAVRALAGRVKGGGLVIAALLGVGGGAGVVAAVDDGDHLASLERRVEDQQDRISKVEQAVVAADSSERMATMEARIASAERIAERQDEALARLTRGLEVQLEVSRHIGDNLERIGRKLNVKLEPLPPAVMAGVNGLLLDTARRRVKGVGSPP